MKPLPESGVLISNSSFFIPFPSNFARKNLFYTDRCGHYYVNRHYIVSRTSPIQQRFVLFYLIKGEMLFIIGGREYICHEHEVVLLDTRSSHLYAAHKDTEFIWICFDGACSEVLVQKICSYNNMYTPSHISRIYNALNEILEGYISQKPLYEEQISSNLHSVLTDLLVPQKEAANATPSVIKQIAKYIEENYFLQLTVTDLSKMACLNSCYFGQKFKLETGISPKQYIINTRLNAAKMLLSSTKDSIAEISEAVGFQNDTYFSYLFHKRFHVTPTEYRNLDTFS